MTSNESRATNEIATLEPLSAQRRSAISSGAGPASDPATASVEHREVSAELSPNSAVKPAAVIVPPGYGFYFSRAVNNGWTDNRDNGSNPPIQGWDFQNDHEYIPEARRAQLVAFAAPRVYVAYERNVDSSCPEYAFNYANRSGITWSLLWYMNDDTGRYGDNRGTANVDIVVYRI